LRKVKIYIKSNEKYIKKKDKYSPPRYRSRCPPTKEEDEQQQIYRAKKKPFLFVLTVHLRNVKIDEQKRIVG
jgi:hypothetical protein